MISLRLLLLAALSMGLGPHFEQIERSVPLMGTVLTLEVRASERNMTLEASEAAIRAVEATEKRLSTWQSTSELAALNRAAPGQEIQLSPALARDLTDAETCWKATKGAFDPAIGSFLTAWNVRGTGRIPTKAELLAAAQGAGLEKIAIVGAVARRLHPAVLVDEGGFGKGAGLERATEALAALEPSVQALLDLGGQLAVVGRDASWSLGIAHPRDRTQTVLRLRLNSGSVATSGNSERGLEVEGRRFSHIIDPRTGWPAEDFGSLTVVTDSAFRADCLSTGLYVLGPERALAWAEAEPGVEVLVLETLEGQLRARCTSGLKSRLDSLDSNLDVEVFVPTAETRLGNPDPTP